MAQRRKKTNNATEKIKSLYIDDNLELLNFGTNFSIKQEEEPKKLKKEKPAKTPFDEWVRNWKEGDALPFSPPGKDFLLDVVSSNRENKTKYGYRDIKPERLRSINEIGLMASKSILGPTLRSMPNALSLIARVARSRGIIVDDDGKLRCPAGTPAANQFTDLQMSNCLVPSARTLANEAADKIKPEQALSGSMALKNRIIPDSKNPDVQTFDNEERARRYLKFRNKKAARFRIVSSIFGDIRSTAGARKALLRAFPGIDKQSLDEFLSNEVNLYGEDLLNYLDFRQQMIASLLYEASKNRELAENVNIVFEKVDQLGGDGDAITISIALGDENFDYDGEDVQQFFNIAYIPYKMATLHKNMEDDHLVIGISNDPNNPLSAGDVGSETGIHEFGHMADFYKFITDMSLDTKTMDFADANKKIIDKTEGDSLDRAWTVGKINSSELFLGKAYSDLMADLSNATSDNDKTKAFKDFYDKIYGRFNDRGPFGLGADDNENEAIAVALSQIVGSLYSQVRDDDDKVKRNETVAELYVALSLFPEELQEAIDEVNNNKWPGYIPDVDELAEMFFGSGVITPASSSQPIRGQSRRTRLRRAVSTFVRPNPRQDPNLDLTDEDVAEYASSIEQAIAERSARKRNVTRKRVLDYIFGKYSSEEIQEILASIPESKRNDNRYIAGLLTVPESLRGKGVAQIAATDWINQVSEALRNDWIDFNAVTAAYSLRGKDGPLRTIRMAARPVAEARKERARRKRSARNAARTTNSLSGNASSNRAARRASRPAKIEGSLSQQRIQKLSGNMGYVKKNNIPIDDERNSPELLPRVAASIEQTDDGKTKITWGDDSWEYDVSDTTDDKIWTQLGLPEWATFHGNFGMRYVSAMLMGLDTPKSIGQDDDPVNAFGRGPIHKALMSGSVEGLSDDDKDRVRRMVQETVSALRSIENEKNKRDYEIYRGLTGVPEGAQILDVKEGDKIEMPLSAFTPSEIWASEMAEFTDEGEGVLVRVLPGAQTTASTSKYDPKAEGQWANAFEVVTAGEFEIVSVEDVDDEPRLITMRQVSVFDTNESQYKNLENNTDSVVPNSSVVPQRLSGSMSSQPDYFQLLKQDSVYTFDGFDRDYVSSRVNEIITKAENKYGKITTVGDARNALKKLFDKVEINHLGLGIDPQNPRSNLSDNLPDHQRIIVMALLYTLGDLPSLKNRRLILSHELDESGNPASSGSNGIMNRSNPPGPDFPYFGTRINIPFDWDTLVNAYFPNEEMSFIDGQSVQMGKSILAAAQLKTGDEQEELIAEAVAMIAVGIAVHEAIHALDTPQRADKIINEISRTYPNAPDDKTRFMYLAQDEEAISGISKTKIMKDVVENYVTGQAGYNIRRAMEYRKRGPEKYIENAKESQQALNEILTDLQNQIDEANEVMQTLPSVGEALQAMFFLEQVQQTYERVENEISRLQDEIIDIETNINDGTPEKSSIAKLEQVVYGAGLNYLFDIIPQGHPGYLSDVEMTVDKDGNMVPFMLDGKMIKNGNSTKEFLESFIIKILQDDDVHDPSLGLIPQEGAASLFAARSSVLGIDSSGEPYFDVGPIFNGYDSDTIDNFMAGIGARLFFNKVDELWPDGISDSSKWEFMDFMRQISVYGAKPPIDYRFGLTFASPSSISSSEVTTELISSLIMGGGAARVPMTPDVRKTALAILDFVYDGDGWKDLLPQISLDALGI